MKFDVLLDKEVKKSPTSESNLSLGELERRSYSDEEREQSLKNNKEEHDERIRVTRFLLWLTAIWMLGVLLITAACFIRENDRYVLITLIGATPVTVFLLGICLKY